MHFMLLLISTFCAVAYLCVMLYWLVRLIDESNVRIILGYTPFTTPQMWLIAAIWPLAWVTSTQWEKNPPNPIPRWRQRIEDMNEETLARAAAEEAAPAPVNTPPVPQPAKPRRKKPAKKATSAPAAA